MQALLDAPSGSDDALARDLGLLIRQLLERSNRSVFQAVDELDLSFTQTKMVMAFTGNERAAPDRRNRRSARTLAPGGQPSDRRRWWGAVS